MKANKPQSTSSNAVTEAGVENVTNGVSLIQNSNSTGSEPIYLPTFSATLEHEGKIKKIRVFKDGGCQRTFIKSSLAEQFKFPILDENLDLNIHGFVSSKNVKTKLVQINIHIGDYSHKIQAICINEIRTTFKIPKMNKIISQFKKRGHKMADETLEESPEGHVKDIEMVLGNDFDPILLMKYISFGNNNHKRSI